MKLQDHRDNGGAHLKSPRIKRELATVAAMIRIYCRAHHESTGELCSACGKLNAYAIKRLHNCTFQDQKPTCANCPVHCYKPSMKQKIITVMRYSGPRMMLYHPYLALRHLLDGKQTTDKLTRKVREQTCNKREPRS